MIGALVVVVAIVVAIAKPWESGPTTPSPAASQVAVTSTGRAPTSARPRRRTPTDGPARLDRGHERRHAARRLGRHRGPRPRARSCRGHARRRATQSCGRRPRRIRAGRRSAVVSRDGADIAALGITAPAGVQPRAVRFWRLHQSNEFEWINAARIDNQAVSHAPLLVRMPLLDGVATVPWDAGQYRVDVLTGDGIHRISVVIEKQFGDVPAARRLAHRGARHRRPRARAIRPPSGSGCSRRSMVRRCRSRPGRRSRSARSGPGVIWRLGDPTVAAMYLPRATGLGVMLTSHAAVAGAPRSGVSPRAAARSRRRRSGGISEAQGRTPYVVFAAPDGGVWAPGVYAVTVDWTDAAGTHHGTWHVALLPGVG